MVLNGPIVIDYLVLHCAVTPMIADELRRQADQFVDIVELQPKISRDPAARAAREAREPRHMPQFLQHGTTPQGAGADEEEFEG